jgi:membrane protease YdiL (CAAX protease family)
METSADLFSPEAKTETGPTRKIKLVELLVFLFLIVPSTALSFFAVKQGSLGFVLVAVATILRDLALVALLLFFIWRNHEPVISLGWSLRHLSREAFLGLALFFPTFIAASGLERVLVSAGFSSPATPLPALQAKGGLGYSVLGLILVAVVAVSEETIFRGYLILRIKALASSPLAAVILSAFIFSLGHGYEGSAGVVTVGFLGLVFAVVYLWRGSLVAPIVMHFLQDFIGIVLLPLLKLK